jgi:hypothetical protein
MRELFIRDLRVRWFMLTSNSPNRFAAAVLGGVRMRCGDDFRN